MTIKEVEQLVDLRKANIRYYEEEGLLAPKRNDQNNYREYEMSDVELLKKIKLLRLLGISLHDIRKLQEQTMMLSSVIQNRVAELQQESQEIHTITKMCNQLLDSTSSFGQIDVSLFDMRSSFFRMRGACIMKMDKIYKLEGYYRVIERGWVIMLMIIMPLKLALRFVRGEGFPNWLDIPFATFMIVICIALGIMRHRIMQYKEETH